MANNKNSNSGMRNQRTRTRGVGSNTAVVTSMKVCDVGAADTTGVKYGFYTMDPLNTSIVTAPVAAIAGAYEFYRIRNIEVLAIPTGGSQYSGSLQHAFIDNSEIMNVFPVMSDAQRSLVITNEEGSETVTLQAPSRKRYNNSRIVARQWFQTNTALSTALGPADFDRTIATMYVFATRGTPGSIAVSLRLQFNITYEFRGLGQTGTYTNLALAGDVFRVPYDTSNGAGFPLVTWQYRLEPNTFPTQPSTCTNP